MAHFLLASFLVHSTLASLPLVDYNRMGQVALTGAFAGLSLFDNSTPSSFDPSTTSLLSRTTQGTLANLGNTNPGGSISSGCPLGDVFYIAGSFSSIGNVSANYLASYSPSLGTFSSVGSNGPNGPVTAVYCDVPNNNLWVGGHFSSPGSSVAIWNTGSNTWSAPPFKGLSGGNSQVFSITPNTSSSSLFFVGSFVTSFAGNSTLLNNTNNPDVPYSPGASPAEYNNIQAILCPVGPDGPGNTWLAQDGNDALITVLTFSSISAYGIRLGNTFISGYGTTGFSVTSIPDNTVQTMSYVDLSTGQNATCTNLCPLSTDSSVLYQDFLFSSPVTLTGIQITLSEWTGAAPGLHMMQLLSSGAFVSAIADGNTQSCFAPNPSNVTSTGTWTTKDASTVIPATLQTVLVSTVAVGTPAAQAPTFTWMPYVSAAGQYDINMVIPGCADFQDCDLRTSVKMTVFPGGGTQPYVSTVSQQNQEDATILIYSGPVVPTSSTFELTVTMALADSPIGSGQNGDYELVAGNLELTLTSANLTSGSGSASSSANSSSSTGILRGFGFFEWPLNSPTSFDATGTVPAASETFLDGAGVELYNALGASISGSMEVSAVIQHPSGVLFLGGNFESNAGFSNIVAFKNGSLAALTNNGLNGVVSSLALYGDDLYIGGSFSDTQNPSMQGKLRGIAVYHIDSGSWGALGAGLNGPVTDVALSNQQLQVVGNFTEALSPSNIASSAGGLAVWDIASGSWINSGGFVLGNMTFICPSSAVGGKTESQFLAGNVQSMAEYGSTGLVMLSDGAAGPAITPVNVQLDANSNASAVSTVNRRREHHPRGPISWFSQRVKAVLLPRQTSSSVTLPPSPPTPAPAVLAGAFWSNASSSKEVAIIGGNFTFVSASGTVSQAVAIYDPSSSTINALSGSQVYGVVHALLVDSEQHLYVGGEFNLSVANGFAIYDLGAQEWLTSIQPLQAASGTPIVRSISNSAYKPNAVIVAGSFSQADTQLNQWSVLGGGIQGDISSVSYAGSNQEFLIAGGAITLPSGATTSVAQYSFSNATWTTVGNPTDIPGPVTALEVNDGNSSSIFAAGRTSDGSSPFMVFWDGISWSYIGTTLQGNSNISQLLMVPLQNTHSPNSVVESDRMLMVSGSLSDRSFGLASSVLFDGEAFIPYITSLSAQGTMGFVSALFYSIANFSFVQQHFLATGIVILISIAIAAGVVFFLALVGILWTLLSRRDDSAAKYDSSDEDKDSIQHRPSSLLEHINAATRTTILGTSAFNVNTEKEEMAREGASAEPDPFGPDGSNYLRAETPSDAVIGTMAAAEEYSRPAHARYAFDGTEEGELPLTVGLEVEVLDDKDAAWWYVRNPQTGQEGVVPAAYLY
ncbi:cortical protein marker for cell polarity-domain-containing protein [Pisolithus marmoratus]|nr:cortical protein marker for cell polarity-domain-containing protein [Pisolithus marmoratus]